MMKEYFIHNYATGERYFAKAEDNSQLVNKILSIMAPGQIDGLLEFLREECGEFYIVEKREITEL